MFSGTRTCIESRIKLECEKEQQEQLLLSVIPAYIAAEVFIKYGVLKYCMSVPIQENKYNKINLDENVHCQRIKEQIL